jgi:hypothetical protein
MLLKSRESKGYNGIKCIPILSISLCSELYKIILRQKVELRSNGLIKIGLFNNLTVKYFHLMLIRHVLQAIHYA